MLAGRVGLQSAARSSSQYLADHDDCQLLTAANRR